MGGPSLNTTADGSLYLTVRDLAAWAVALNHRRLPGPAELEAAWTPVRLRSGGSYPYGLGWYLGEQRGRRRIGHGGSWQGFRASIQRYPEFDLTVIVLTNLEQAEPEAISYAVAGLLEPALAAAHLAPPAAAGAPAPPRPIPALLEEVATGRAGAATAALERFLSPRARRAVGELGGPDVAWSFIACDDVARRGVIRLGAAVARSCYARGTAGGGAHLVEVAYTGDWKAAFIDWYDY